MPGGHGTFKPALPKLREKGLARVSITNEITTYLGNMMQGPLGAEGAQIRRCPVVECKITARKNSSYKGMYDAKMWDSDNNKYSLSATITESDFGTLPSSANAVVFNVADIGGTWKITVGDYVQGRLIGRYSDGTDTPPWLIIVNSYPKGLFPVKVTQTGGSNGNKTTAASYTYTVNDLNNDQLGTSIALAKSRPYGLVTAGSTYGLAFYDGSTLKLWDAGEYPGSGGC
jgi:hypothetical protein